MPFYVDLRQECEVSWKKLAKLKRKRAPSSSGEPAPGGAARDPFDRGFGDGAAGDHPLERKLGFGQRQGPQRTDPLLSVIQRLERQNAAACSSDSDEGDSDGDTRDDGGSAGLPPGPSDAAEGAAGKQAVKRRFTKEDEYDHNDDFLDDSEVVHYHDRARGKGKHSGFFINKGALEGDFEELLAPAKGSKGSKAKAKAKSKAKASSSRSTDDFRPKKKKKGLKLKKLTKEKGAAAGPSAKGEGGVKKRVAPKKAMAPRPPNAPALVSDDETKSDGEDGPEAPRGHSMPAGVRPAAEQPSPEADPPSPREEEEVEEEPFVDSDGGGSAGEDKSRSLGTGTTVTGVHRASVAAPVPRANPEGPKLGADMLEMLERVEKLADQAKKDAAEAEKLGARRIRRLPPTIQDLLKDIGRLWAATDGVRGIKKKFFEQMMQSLSHFIEPSTMRNKIQNAATPYRMVASKEEIKKLAAKQREVLAANRVVESPEKEEQVEVVEVGGGPQAPPIKVAGAVMPPPASTVAT